MDSSSPDVIAPEADAEPVVPCQCAYAYQRECLSSSGQAYPLEVTRSSQRARAQAARSRPVSDAPARGARPGSPASNPHKTPAFSRHTSFFLDHGCARVHTHRHAHDDGHSDCGDDGLASSLDAAPVASAGTRAVSWHVPRSRVGGERGRDAAADSVCGRPTRAGVPMLPRDRGRVRMAALCVRGVRWNWIRNQRRMKWTET
jgi:hypothetical protein